MSHQAHDSKSFYRPDIDGLRAIAVLAVVLFHIDPALLPGGFVGVDIFFVISGYLITANIIKDALSPRGFSWSEFYRRRILRILPVLFVVLLTVLVVGQFVLLPADLQKLGYSSVAAVLSVANVYFTYFLDTSYFADDSSLQPLLHLWSLGVEEQFYLFWPVLLVVLIGRLSKPRLLLVTFLLAAASFALAQALLKGSPMFAYYMLPPRAGELLVGAMLAIWLSNGQRAPGPKLSIVLGGVGMVLIVASLGWITEDKGFPGIAALPSTVGAALVILAGSGGVRGLGHVLALRPMVLIGLISYSLYLWHWPVLAFYRYTYGVVGTLDGALLFIVMVALSVLSYRLVEKPCRQLRWTFPRAMGQMFVGGSFAVLLLCAGVYLTQGYGVYVKNAEYRRALAELTPAPPAYRYPYVCQQKELGKADMNRDSCILGNSMSEPDVLLWGDSNAAHYVGVLGVIARKAGFSFRNVAHSSCPPVLSGVEKIMPPDRLEACRKSLEHVYGVLDRYSTIILGGAWATYFRWSPDFGVHIEHTVDTLLSQGKRVVILGQVPNFKAIDRGCRQKALKLPISCQQAGVEADSGDTRANRFLAGLTSTRPSLSYFDVRSQVCRDGYCNAYMKNKLLYFDNSHFSMDGSWAIGKALVAERGVPRQFASLAPTASADGFADQEESVPEKFRVAEQAWVPLLGEGGSVGWSGNALKSALDEGGLQLSDENPDNYEVVTYRLRGAQLQSILNGADALLVRLKLADCSGVKPLLRVWTRDGEQRIHDALLNCDIGQLQTRLHMQSENVGVVFEGEAPVLYAYLPVSPSLNDVVIGLYPAVGDAAGKYSKVPVGNLKLKRVEVAVVKN